MIGVRLVDGQQLPLAGWLEHAVGAHCVFGDDGVAVGVGVINVRVLSVGRKREAEQTPLAASRNGAGEIEHWLGVEYSIADGRDLALAADHKQGLVARAIGEIERAWNLGDFSECHLLGRERRGDDGRGGCGCGWLRVDDRRVSNR